MKKENRIRINLTVDSESLKFAKEWSYITEISLSRLFDLFFNKQLEECKLHIADPEGWYTNPNLNYDLKLKEENIHKSIKIKDELLDLKEQELRKKKPDQNILKTYNLTLKAVNKNIQNSSVRDWHEMEEFVRRWCDIFG